MVQLGYGTDKGSERRETHLVEKNYPNVLLQMTKSIRPVMILPSMLPFRSTSVGVGLSPLRRIYSNLVTIIVNGRPKSAI